MSAGAFESEGSLMVCEPLFQTYVMPEAKIDIFQQQNNFHHSSKELRVYLL